MNPRALGWFFASILAIDLMVGWGVSKLSSLGAGQSIVRFFSYGYSLEHKIRTAIDDVAYPKRGPLHAGWIDDLSLTNVESTSNGSRVPVYAFYGQSFTFRVAKEMALINDAAVGYLIGAPAAPLGHSFFAYKKVSGMLGVKKNVVGILASSFCGFSINTGLAFSFENPAPYTFPSYSIGQDGVLIEAVPPILGEGEFRSAFKSRSKEWASLADSFKYGSPVHDSFTFDEGYLDRSVLVRLARRGVVSARNEDLKNELASSGVPKCFDKSAPVALAILKEWQKIAKDRGQSFFVVLFEDRGYKNALRKSLGKSLENSGIGFVVTSDFVDPSDSKQLEADGHFKSAGSREIARALLKAVDG